MVSMRKEGTPYRWQLGVLAVAIGVVIVGGTSLIFDLAAGRPLAPPRSGAVVQLAVVVLPYLVLAALGARTFLPWLVGLAATLTLWGWYLIDGLSRLSGWASADANIGLGILLLASPFCITALCVIAHLVQSRTGRGR